MEKSCTMRGNHRDFIRELTSVLSWFELTVYKKTVNLFQDEIHLVVPGGDSAESAIGTRHLVTPGGPKLYR